MERKMEEMQNAILSLKSDLAGLNQQFDQEKAAFNDDVQREFVNHKLMLREVVEEARKEFLGLRAGIQELHDKTEATVSNLHQRVSQLEGNTSTSWNNQTRGYLPQKSMIPNTSTDKHDEWRIWQEEVADYMDTMTPGMK